MEYLSIDDTYRFTCILLGDNINSEVVNNIFKKTEGEFSSIFRLFNNLFKTNSNRELLLNNNESLCLAIDNVEIHRETYNLVIMDVIYTCTIFNSAVSSDVLEEIVNISMENLYETLYDLESFGMIIKAVDDWGISYSFSNVKLKQFIYNKMPLVKKASFHEKAALILSTKYEKENRLIKDELIYQLIRANKKEESIYTIERYINWLLSSFNCINAGIEYLIKAIELCDTESFIRTKIRLLYKLGDLYNRIGNNNKASFNYNIAQLMAYNIDSVKEIN